MNILLPILLITGVFGSSLSNYFSGDDWFHLRVSQIGSVHQFFNFFSFSHTAESVAFYRPLSTQAFFFLFQKVFGLSVWPYHLFVLMCFAYSLLLVYRFAKQLRKIYSKPKSRNNLDSVTNSFELITTVVYGLSVSNFTRIYFLSAFQEISLVIFSLLCLLSFPKNKLKSLAFFVLALMSKETAVILPLLIILFNFQEIKKSISKFIPISVVLIFYLYLRFKIFGSTEGDSYIWNFSPVKAANTFMWYLLWSFGAPELLVDYVGSGLRLVPKFFSDFPLWWKLIIPLLLGTIITSLVLAIEKAQRLLQWGMDGFRVKPGMTEGITYVLFFLIALLPVLFLPSHKFSLELGLPLVGFSLAIAWLVSNKISTFSYIFLLFYIALNLSMNYLTYTRHYSVNRGKVSNGIASYLSATYPKYPVGKYFEFVNDVGDYGKEWGQSKQISQSISGSDLFRVFYKNANINVYYQDFPGERPKNETAIYLSTKKFIK